MTEAILEYSAQEVSDETKSGYGSYLDHALALPLWAENGVVIRCISDESNFDHWIEVGRLEQ